MLAPKTKHFEPPEGNWINNHTWPQETRPVENEQMDPAEFVESFRKLRERLVELGFASG